MEFSYKKIVVGLSVMFWKKKKFEKLLFEFEKNLLCEKRNEKILPEKIVCACSLATIADDLTIFKFATLYELSL